MRRLSDNTCTPLAFESLCNLRKSEYNFDSRSIDENTIKDILLTTQTAPSSFNLQPYKIVMVKSEIVRSAIADNAMLGTCTLSYAHSFTLSRSRAGYSNSSRVRTAPLTAVFLADKIPSELIKKVMKLELENGNDPTYVSSLPSKVRPIFTR